jgi:hypothetical protein
MSELMSLDLILIAACIWLAIGLVGVSQPHNFRLISRVLFPLGAFISLLVAGIALASVAAEPQFRILPLGLPDLPFHLRLDALSSFFLFLLGATSAGISIYAAGYFRPSEGGQPDQHRFHLPRRRWLCLHGGLGIDGAQLFLSRCFGAPARGDPARRLSLPHHRAYRRAFHSVVLWRNGRQRR